MRPLFLNKSGGLSQFETLLHFVEVFRLSTKVLHSVACIFIHLTGLAGPHTADDLKCPSAVIPQGYLGWRKEWLHALT